MIRGSDKHSSRVDEQREHEVEALVHGAPDEGRTEYRSKEAPGEEEVTLDELGAREQLARHLLPSAFPATAGELMDAARETHAPPDVLASLDRLAADRTFQTTQEVWEALRTV